MPGPGDPPGWAGRSVGAAGPSTWAFLATCAGVAIAALAGIEDLSGSDGLFLGASALLAVGLYGSTSGIDLTVVRHDLGLVVAAVTVGVLAKAALVAGVMYLAFGNPAYIVLGAAMAQIDPLSVAAIRRRDKLSPRARSILAVWSSFDDPVTVLLTIYASALAFEASGRTDGLHTMGSGLVAYVGSFGSSLLLAAAVVGSRVAVDRLLRRRHIGTSRTKPALRQALTLCALAMVLAVAAANFLMLGVALIGLFVRPLQDRTVDRAVRTAFLVAAALLGVLLVDGVDLWAGALLGVTAYVAQVLVSIPLTRRLDRADSIVLALAQQNGITAIILALVLEADFPGTVGVVGPAIFVVNSLHVAGNALARRPRLTPAPSSQPVSSQTSSRTPSTAFAATPPSEVVRSASAINP